MPISMPSDILNIWHRCLFLCLQTYWTYGTSTDNCTFLHQLNEWSGQYLVTLLNNAMSHICQEQTTIVSTLHLFPIACARQVNKLQTTFYVPVPSTKKADVISTGHKEAHWKLNSGVHSGICNKQQILFRKKILKSEEVKKEEDEEEKLKKKSGF